MASGIPLNMSSGRFVWGWLYSMCCREIVGALINRGYHAAFVHCNLFSFLSSLIVICRKGGLQSFLLFVAEYWVIKCAITTLALAAAVSLVCRATGNFLCSSFSNTPERASPSTKLWILVNKCNYLTFVIWHKSLNRYCLLLYSP